MFPSKTSRTTATLERTDEVLIEPLKAAINSSAQKLLIVLHTLGSHENYAYRYPLEFDLYFQAPGAKGRSFGEF